jgi:hypothetical protein
MKSWYALALVLASVTVPIWLFHIERKEQAETVPVAVDALGDNLLSESSQEIAGLREELAQMKDQLARVLKQQAHRAPPGRPATAAQPKALATDVQDQDSGDSAQSMLKMNPPEREAQERQRIEQVVSHLDDSFHNESYDSDWAAQIETGITDDFKGIEWNSSTLADTSCRSTLCRVVVTHKNLGAADEFVARMGTLQAFANTEGFYQHVTLEDGTSATVVYIARQGHRLPPIPLQ